METNVLKSIADINFGPSIGILLCLFIIAFIICLILYKPNIEGTDEEASESEKLCPNNVRLLIAMSGGGKTYKLKNEIVHELSRNEGIVNPRDFYVVEREEYHEYEIFNEKYVKVLTPSSDVSFLKDVKNSKIYIDCEDYSDEFLNEVAQIAVNAAANNNIITITFLGIDDLTRLPVKTIFSQINNSVEATPLYGAVLLHP